MLGPLPCIVRIWLHWFWPPGSRTVNPPPHFARVPLRLTDCMVQWFSRLIPLRHYSQVHCRLRVNCTNHELVMLVISQRRLLCIHKRCKTISSNPTTVHAKTSQISMSSSSQKLVKQYHRSVFVAGSLARESRPQSFMHSGMAGSSSPSCPPQFHAVVVIMPW